MSSSIIKTTSISTSGSNMDLSSSSDSWEDRESLRPDHKQPVVVVQATTPDTTAAPRGMFTAATTPDAAGVAGANLTTISSDHGIPLGHDGCGTFFSNILSLKGFLGGFLAGVAFMIIIFVIVDLIRRRRRRKSRITRIRMSDMASPCLLNIQTSVTTRADAEVEAVSPPADDNVYEDPLKTLVTTGAVADLKAASSPADDNVYEDPIKTLVTTGAVADLKAASSPADDNVYEDPIKVLLSPETAGTGDQSGAATCYVNERQLTSSRADVDRHDNDDYDKITNTTTTPAAEDLTSHTYAGFIEGRQGREDDDEDNGADESAYQNTKRSCGYRGRQRDSLNEVRQTMV